MSTGSNTTGHWISKAIVKKTSNKSPNKLHVKVKQSFRNLTDAQTVQLDGIVIVPPPRPADYELFPGVGYYKFHIKNANNFDDALAKCANEGGHLAIINSDTEALVLQEIFARYPKNGMVDSEPLNSTGFVKWVDPTQPDNYNNIEDCGAVHRNGGLNDIGCFGEFPFFCEYDLSWGYI
ncbi:hypothetical protein J437_LFUL005883 [Ladona fulva]|uniref:C-type lectin domain-containing protein n=1 Tax=Ladona fulva TaxID=123851 RepID=A0A8K0K7I9_LADFU|nr:hypothetical protein J437_LFUL005883 [Ladona fulva]